MTGLEVIYASIDVVNNQSDVGVKIKKSSSTKLLGVGSEIDSLMFVNLIVAIEEMLFDEKGRVITLVTEDAMNDDDTPFESVGKLASYIDNLVTA